MSQIAITGAATGTATFTIESPATSTNRTLTIPDNTGTFTTTGSTGGVSQAMLATGVAGTGPTFSAYADTDQTVSDATATKITFGTEEFDTNNNFASSRFTPTVAGYYQVNSTVNCSQTAIVDFVLWIYKNGSQYKRGFGFAGTAQAKFIAPVSTLVYLNGTTDHVEVYAYSDGTGSATINSGEQNTWFNASMVRGA